jgi:hypothetical protein
MSGVVTRGCLRFAVWRWPAAGQADAAREWGAEIHAIEGDTTRGLAARRWRSFLFAVSLACARPHRSAETPLALPLGPVPKSRWRPALVSLIMPTVFGAMATVVSWHVTVVLFTSAYHGNNSIWHNHRVAAEVVTLTLALWPALAGAWLGRRLGRFVPVATGSDVGDAAVIGAALAIGMMVMRLVPVVNRNFIMALSLPLPMAFWAVCWALGFTALGWGVRAQARRDRPLVATALAIGGAAVLNEIVVVFEAADLGGHTTPWTLPQLLTDARWLVGPLPLPFSGPYLGIYPVVQIAATAFALTFIGLRAHRPVPAAVAEPVAG